MRLFNSIANDSACYLQERPTMYCTVGRLWTDLPFYMYYVVSECTRAEPSFLCAVAHNFPNNAACPSKSISLLLYLHEFPISYG